MSKMKEHLADIQSGKGKYQPVLVGIDGPEFPAVADPTDRWNGWLGTPWFDRETAQQVADWVNDEGTNRITIDDEGAWLFEGEHADDHDDPRGDLSPWTDINGTQRVTIGARNWCWSDWPVETYHGISRVSCRSCDWDTNDIYTMEVINDLEANCPSCDSSAFDMTIHGEVHHINP